MSKKFAAKLTNAQFKLARAFERANLTTISQAVKTFERDDQVQIERWKRQLAVWQKAHDAQVAAAMRKADELTDGGRNDPSEA